MTDLGRVRLQECRNQILRVLDTQRPEPVGLSIISRSLDQGLAMSKQDLLRELDYLQSKDLITPMQVLWTLTPYGVDVLESTVESPPGIPEASPLSRQERSRRQEIRWRILRVLDVARPIGASTELLWRSLDDASLLCSDKELRRESLYLEGKGLINIDKSRQRGLDWQLRLSPQGIDVVEYSTDAPPGIDRPKKYWE